MPCAREPSARSPTPCSVSDPVLSRTIKYLEQVNLGDDHFSNTLEVVDIGGVHIGGWRQALLLLKFRHITFEILDDEVHTYLQTDIVVVVGDDVHEAVSILVLL